MGELGTRQDRTILIIGAAGEMCRHVVQRLAPATDAKLVLADINLEPVEALLTTIPPGQASTLKLDLYDHSALLKAMEHTALVLLAAGPYIKTSKPVLAACLEAGVPYLDFDDDVESTQSALDLHEKASQLGVPCYIGCGASPGMTNILAMDASAQLDEVNAIDVCWLVGQEQGGAGKAVLEHTMHIAAGPCLTWEDSKPVLHETFVETAYAPMLGRTSEVLMHETAHPEPTTLPRRLKGASRIRCLGGITPQPKWGNARGFATAVRRGTVQMSDAVDFLYDLRRGALPLSVWGNILVEFNEQTGGSLESTAEITKLIAEADRSNGLWRLTVKGLVDQVKSGECTKEEVVDFLLTPIRVASGAEFKSTPSSLLVRAVGSRKGRPCVIMKRTPTPGEGATFMKTLGSMTGTCCAAFTVLALGSLKAGGVYAPEDWVEPQMLYQALERVGVPPHEIVEDY